MTALVIAPAMPTLPITRDFLVIAYTIAMPAITSERSRLTETEYPARMDEDLHALGEDLITTAARVVRWVPKEDGFGISLAAARLLARLHDNGPTRISDLALAEKCSQPTITNHVKRLEAAHLVDRTADPRDARAWMIKLTKKGYQQLSSMRASIGTSLEPYLATMSKRDIKALREGVEAMQRLMAVNMETRTPNGVPPSGRDTRS